MNLTPLFKVAPIPTLQKGLAEYSLWANYIWLLKKWLSYLDSGENFFSWHKIFMKF